MFTISKNGIITLSRGDDVEMPLFINKGTPLEPIRYTITDNICVYLGLMLPGQEFEDALLKQKYTNNNLNGNGDIIIKFTSNDTLYLDPGKYFYEIKILLEDGSINTIIQKTEFYLI